MAAGQLSRLSSLDGTLRARTVNRLRTRPLLAGTPCRAARPDQRPVVVNLTTIEDANMSKLLTTLIAAVFAAVSFAAVAADATPPAKPADAPKAEAKAPEAKADTKTTK